MFRSLSRGRLAAFALACVVPAVVVAGCGSSSGGSSGTATSSQAATSGQAATTSTSCNGSPAKLSVITNLSNTGAGAQVATDVVGGFKAAAAAINATCELGQPIEIVACDDQASPNGGANCGRKAVADKVFGVAAYTGTGDSYSPPVLAAKIPLVPWLASSASESTSKLSFPFGDAIPIIMADAPAAKAAGANSLAMLHLDIPAVKFLVDLAKQQADAVGVKIAADVPVPLTASDMGTYTAQALDANPESLTTIVAPAQASAIFKQVVAQGKDPSTFPLITGANAMTPATIKSLPSDVTDGMVIIAWSLDPNSPSDRDKPPVKQYLSELAAAKLPAGPLDATANGLAAWGEMHSIADALKATGLKPTAENLPRALVTDQMPTITQKYGQVPRDFRKPAFPDNPALKNLRIFSQDAYYYKINAEGQPVAQVSEPTSVLTVPTFKPVGG